MKQTQKDYKAILDNLDSAEGYPDNKPEQIRTLRRRVFVLIENEKNEAKMANQAMKKAEYAEIQAKKAMQKAMEQLEIEKQTAIIEKTKAQAAEAKATAVLDKIYFYNGTFGLAYSEEAYYKRYGFINRNLETKIEFKYTEALPFDYEGFAKVKRDDMYFLIDTTGHEYRLATEINQLDSSIVALDLRGKNLSTVPPSVFQQKQLLILLLSNNQLTDIPSSIGQLINVQYLNLSGNYLASLPNDIGKLKSLQYSNLGQNKLKELPAEIGNWTQLHELNLNDNLMLRLPDTIKDLVKLQYLYLRGGNELPHEERVKIEERLPNCHIFFY